MQVGYIQNIHFYKRDPWCPYHPSRSSTKATQLPHYLLLAVVSFFFFRSFLADVTESCLVLSFFSAFSHTLSDKMMQLKQLWAISFARISPHITFQKKVKVAQSGKTLPKTKTPFYLNIFLDSTTKQFNCNVSLPSPPKTYMYE